MHEYYTAVYKAFAKTSFCQFKTLVSIFCICEHKVYKSLRVSMLKMGITQHRSKKKPTGARYLAARGKRKFEAGTLPTMTKVGSQKTKTIRVKGGNRKMRVLSAEFVNLLDPKTKKFEKVKIVSAKENPANRHFVIRNILTKGAIVETEKGKAKITNRPGQEGAVNAILVTE
jgi:small subunit ribosomal protein S8e